MTMRYDEKQRFSDRLNQALDEAGVPPKGKGRQQIAGRMFGVSQRGARKWLEAEAIPDTHKLPAIAAKLGIRAEWLLSGTGPMRDPFTNLAPETIALAQIIAKVPIEKVRAALVLLGVDVDLPPVRQVLEDKAKYDKR